jgi:hypothetical protein
MLKAKLIRATKQGFKIWFRNFTLIILLG